MDLEGVFWIHVNQDRTKWCAVVRTGGEPAGYKKKFLTS